MFGIIKLLQVCEEEKKDLFIVRSRLIGVVSGVIVEGGIGWARSVMLFVSMRAKNLLVREALSELICLFE